MNNIGSQLSVIGDFKYGFLEDLIHSRISLVFSIWCGSEGLDVLSGWFINRQYGIDDNPGGWQDFIL